ncbi:MAG: hypothetical protein EXS05_23475 [Planctomycetaceae bacterium]|nr:hypothetical protein [Planctomycetaceae bacterium]
MTGSTVHEELRDFTTQLIEQCGGMVEWPPGGEGTAMLPPEVGRLLSRHGEESYPEEFRLTERPGEPGLCVSLATDFLDTAGAVLEAAVPRIGAFHLADRYLKRGDLQEAIGRTYTWLNARVRLREPQPVTIEYHTWWCLVSLRSEDYWETRLAVTLNSATLAEVDLPDPLELPDLQPHSAPEVPSVDTCERALKQARAHLKAAAISPLKPGGFAAGGRRATPASAGDSGLPLGTSTSFQQSAAEFIRRMDGRLARDRKRLEEYYGALLRETRSPGRRRSAPPPDPAQQESKTRAVKLELRRKLSELEERYTMQARIRPIALVRTTIPALAIGIEVQRRSAKRTHTIYWNSLLKQFEPLPCSLCGRSLFSPAFTDDEVAPVCSACHHKAVPGKERAVPAKPVKLKG